MPDIDLNKLVKVHLKIRDTRDELRKTYEAKDNELKAKQERLENEMLRQLQEAGADSIRTPSGTVIKYEEVKPRADDWDAIYKWIVENDGWEMLERRLKQRTVKEFMEEHHGALPPGVSVFRSFVARVRRS